MGLVENIDFLHAYVFAVYTGNHCFFCFQCLISCHCVFFPLHYRGDSSSNSATVGERLLSTLLTEMDGLEEATVSTKSNRLCIQLDMAPSLFFVIIFKNPFQGILVLAATNRPYAIDAALMRPGRFDLVRFHIYNYTCNFFI